MLLHAQIAGPAGCGKTQFCIMLSMLATLPQDRGRLAASVIYIDTEAAFSATRLGVLYAVFVYSQGLQQDHNDILLFTLL